MNKDKKHTVLWRRLRALLMCLLMVICGSAQALAASSVIYHGPLWTDTSQGKVRVGHFTVDGKTAFCMEHSKESPSTGTSLTNKVYRNAAVRKILYYGWEGPGQWKGFSGMKQGITLTSLLLSEVYSKAQPVGTYNFVPGLVEFRKYVNGQPAPSLDLKFSKSSAQTYYDGALDAERTESIEVLGTGAGSLTITVPAGCLLIKDDEELTGTVRLEAGDSFYIRSEERFSREKQTEIKGRGMALQPLVYVTASTGLQDLTRLEYAQDTAETTRLTINWMGRTDLRIIKLDADTGDRVSGAIFRLLELDPEGNPTAGGTPEDINSLRNLDGASSGVLTVEADGSAAADLLEPGRSYLVIEMQAPPAYKLSDEIKQIEVTGDKECEEVEFHDEKQLASIVISKEGEKYAIVDGELVCTDVKLEGAVFELSAEEDITGWDGKVLYRKGRVIGKTTSDVDGHAEFSELPPGKYSIREIEAPSGYVLDVEPRICDLKVDSDKAELKYNLSWTNFTTDSEVKVVKYDKSSGELLKGASFTIEDEDGNALKVTTGEDGTATIRDLPPGEYVFTEVKAPEGYRLDLEPQKFRLNGEPGEIVVLESYDLRSDTPNTADETDLIRILIYAILLVTSAAGIDVMVHKRRRRS